MERPYNEYNTHGQPGGSPALLCVKALMNGRKQGAAFSTIMLDTAQHPHRGFST